MTFSGEMTEMQLADRKFMCKAAFPPTEENEFQAHSPSAKSNLREFSTTKCFLKPRSPNDDIFEVLNSHSSVKLWRRPWAKLSWQRKRSRVVRAPIKTVTDCAHLKASYLSRNIIENIWDESRGGCWDGREASRELARRGWSPGRSVFQVCAANFVETVQRFAAKTWKYCRRKDLCHLVESLKPKTSHTLVIRIKIQKWFETGV